MKILFLSHTFYGSYFVVGSHKLAREMVDRCQETWHISTPVRTSKKNKPTGNEKHRLDLSGKVLQCDGISTYIPKTRWLPHTYLIHRDRVLKGLEMPQFDLIIVDQPTFLLSALILKMKMRARIIYRPTDVYIRLDLRLLGYFFCKLADAFVLTSRKCLGKRFYLKNKKPLFVRTNGLESNANFFSKSEIRFKQLQNRQLSAVYVGAIDERIDFDFLNKLMSMGWFDSIDLYGPSEMINFTVPGISICGELDYQDLNKVLQSYDFGILPFNDSKKNSSRSPMKLFEYLSNGLRVVSPNTYDLPDEVKHFESVILKLEKNFQKSELIDKLRRESSFVIDKNLMLALSFGTTADLLLQLGSD